MRVPFLDFLKSGPPAPRVALLPDTCFFTRTIPIEAGTTPEQLAGLIELSLETLSPFPFHQLNRGHFWVPGANQVLVFAAYRRRFTQDQVHAWHDAEWVAPSFCALLGMAPKTHSTVLYRRDEALTAVQWTGSPVPSRVLVRPLPLECTPEQFTQAKDSLLKEMGELGSLLELEAAPSIIPSGDEKSMCFHTGSTTFSLERSLAAAMDVRPAEELAEIRGARKRETLMWQGTLGLACTLLFLGLAEIALAGGWAWQKTRKLQVTSQQPVVDKVMTSQLLASRIDELATKRLLPFEMITVLSEKRPKSIQFTRTTTSGLLSMKVDANTPNIADIVAWESALKEQPAIESVEVPPADRQTSNNKTRFTLIAHFKADGLKSE